MSCAAVTSSTGRPSSHFNNLFSTERHNNPRLLSDRSEAKKYFRLAINAYQEALQLDPTLGTESESLVNVKLNEARNYLARLNQSAPSSPQNFGRPLLSEGSSVSTTPSR